MQRWMKAQADYTRARLDAMPGYAKLYQRIDELSSSVPAQVSDVQIVAGHYYSLRRPQGAQSPKLFVRDGDNGHDKSHFSLHSYRPSPDNHYVAYTIAAGGSEEPVLHILDASTGKDLREIAEHMAFSAPSWRPDGRAFFYARRQVLAPGTSQSEKLKNTYVAFHVIGRDFDADPRIVGNGVSNAFKLGPVEFPEIVASSNSRYAIAMVSPGTDPRLRIYVAPLASIKDSKTAWQTVAASYDDQYIGSDNSDYPAIALTGDTLYWLSRKNAPRGEILKLDLSKPNSKPETVIAQGEFPISAVYAGHDAIYWRVNDAGANSIHRLRLTKDAKPEALTLPYSGDVAGVSTDDASDAVALLVNSYLRSPAFMSVDAQTGKLTDDGLQPAGPYDKADDLTVDEVKVKSWDGTLVPLSIVHKQGIKLDGNNTAMITGYGAYGSSTSPFYVPAMRSWYDHAQIIVFAHVRGGGEYGEAWHLGGYKATKPNTWKDFIACAQYLVDHKYTQPSKLFGWSQSAGGILIGRAIEERPDLLAVAVDRVPLTDTLRFETTANGPDNVPEFGSVKDPQGFKALYAMSSYAHVRDGVKYPPVLIYAGFNDQRVAAWEPAKLAARLQAATASGKPVLLRVDYDAGHTGFDATRAQSDRNTADMLAFALWQMGDPEFQPKH